MRTDDGPVEANSAAASAAAAARLYAAEYSPEVYQALSDDTVRVEAYRRAIAARCKGKRVLDVGTGPVALLAVIAARAGAKHVTAIEVSEHVAAQARAVVQREGLSDVIEVVYGFSTQVPLPEVDLVIHELIGDIASEEGLPLVLADLQRRLRLFEQARAGWVVPRRTSTWVAPINLHLASAATAADLDEELLEEEEPEDQQLEDAEGGAEEEAEAAVDMAASSAMSEIRLPSALPTAALLGGRQELESLDAEESVQLQPIRTLTWKVGAPSTLTGFVCAPRIEFDADNVIDAWDEQTHWRHVAVMLPEAALVEAGDEVRLDVEMDLRSFPSEYRFAASLRAGCCAAAAPPAEVFDAGEASKSPAFRQLGSTVIRLDTPVEQPSEAVAPPPAKRQRVAEGQGE